MKGKVEVTKRILKDIYIVYTLLKEGRDYTIIASSFNRATNEKEIQCVREISQNYKQARKIFNIVCKGKVSPVHLHDVIYDLMC